MAVPILKIFGWWQPTLLEMVAVVSFENWAIGNDPGLHAGRHEKDLVVGGAGGWVPLVALRKVFPRFLGVSEWVFAVDQHGNVVFGSRLPMFGCEMIEGSIASAGCG